MWDVLKEYPAARVRLEAIAVKRLEKYKKAPLEKGKAYFSFYFANYPGQKISLFCLRAAAIVTRLDVASVIIVIINNNNN